MVTLRFYGLIRLITKREEITVDIKKTAKVKDVLIEAQKQVPVQFIQKIIDDNGNLVPGTIVMINSVNIHNLDLLDSVVKDGDKIGIFPPGAGG